VIRTDCIDVRGMHCGGCERSVRTAVEGLAGVRSARADHLAEELEVTYDPGVVELAAIRVAVTEAGFVAA
jgi:copper chaperone CopZ